MKIKRTVWKNKAMASGAVLALLGLTAHSLALTPPAPRGANGVALSPDGKVVAAFGYGIGQETKIWNVPGQFSYPSIEGNQWRYIGFSVDSQFLQATDSSLTRSWEITTGKEQPYQYGGLSEPYSAFAVSKDWKHLAQVVHTGVDSPPSELKIQHVGKISLLLPNFDPNSALAFSPDGQLLACVGYIPQTKDLPERWSQQLYLRVFDTRTGDLCQTVAVGPSNSAKVSFIGQGKIVVAVSDGKLTLFAAATLS